MVEVLMAAVLSTVIVGAVVGIYVFAWRAWTRIGGRQLASHQADTALRAVLADARQALAYDLLPRKQGTALTLTLPADADAHGVYFPVPVKGKVVYRSGPRYVYYLSDTSGRYDRAGHALWRGQVLRKAAPSQATVKPDTAWSLYYDTGRPRYDGLVALDLAPGPAAVADQYFTCSVTARTQTEEADSPSATISSGAFLRFVQFTAASTGKAAKKRNDARETPKAKAAPGR